MTDPEKNDIEQAVEETDGEEQSQDEQAAIRERWERGQRELMTYAFDFNAATLTSLVQNGQLNVTPGYQRRDRWDIRRRSRLIESFLLNIPVPSIYLSEDEAGIYSVIDGMHRIAAVVDFMEDRYALSGLSVFFEANGKKYSDLDIGIQRALAARATMRATVISHLSDPVMQYGLFERLNTGGVPLNAQEVRNSTFSGPYNDLLVELSETPSFRSALDIASPGSSPIWREMKDVELVLRYFTLRHSWQDFHGSMTLALNSNMAENAQADPALLDEMRQDFLQTLNKARVAFGEGIFRRWHWSGRPSSRIVVAVYDAQMLAVRDFPVGRLEAAAHSTQAEMSRLFGESHFIEAVTSYTNSPNSLRLRVDTVIRMLQNCLG
ncbi:DUF262 domain-containing protein [Streptomyces albidoflavus]|uniref:DUF262 domain-containing protein n=1 Tax=Streptomyces albidoflavus TaxID=1886 RepID=UPI00344CB66B